MLLPTVLPAVVEIRADAVSRVYVNIEIGGKGGLSKLDIEHASCRVFFVPRGPPFQLNIIYFN